MLCLGCRYLGEPETLLQGSDRRELAGWICGVLPGFLYCAWRHFLRAKVCAHCGGSELMREAAHAAANRPAQAAGRARIRSARPGDVLWPTAIRMPRARIAMGWRLSSGLSVFTVALGATSQNPASSAWLVVLTLWLALVGWFSFRARPLTHTPHVPASVSAWDDTGRRLYLEQI